MTIAVTYNEVKALHPCEEGLKSATKKLGGIKKWNAKAQSFATLRAAGVPFDDLIWLASALAHDNKDIERRLRLWIADCAARVLHIYEKTGLSPAPRAAIVATRQFARGEISAAAGAAAAWAAAGDAAWAAAGAAARAAAGDAAAWAAAGDAAWAAAGDAAAWAAAGDAAWAAAGDAARAAAGDAAGDAEEAWQLDRLIVWLSDDEPEDWPLPPQKTSGIPQMMLEERERHAKMLRARQDASKHGT